MIEVICGPMFARKSEEERYRVERRVYARKHVWMLRPALDTRPEVSTHGGHVLKPGPYLKIEREVKGDTVPPHAPIRTALAVFTEAQFFGEDVIHWVKDHAERNIDVLVTCLDRDYKGQPFGAIKELLFIADKVVKLTAVCMKCGKDATRTQRLVSVTDQILVGEAETYESRCAACHRP